MQPQTATVATNSEKIRLSSPQIAQYRTDGFTKVEGVITPEEAAYFRHEFMACAEQYAQTDRLLCNQPVFMQAVNMWRDFPQLRKLWEHPRITSAATQLAGVPLRLWHDHLLVKRPQNGAPTEFHQDQPYWPFVNDESSAHSISCWVALVDVPFDRGCMTFLPGSHRHRQLEAQNLKDRRDLFAKCPELECYPRVTLPLKAGDCTFHHGFCAHMANANMTTEDRVAVSIIYMDRTTRFSGKSHICVKGLGLEVGAPIQGPDFIEV